MFENQLEDFPAMLILEQKGGGNGTHVNHIFFSTSACTSASLEPSYVLRAIGADEDLAHSSIRYGLHKWYSVNVSVCMPLLGSLSDDGGDAQ